MSILSDWNIFLLNKLYFPTTNDYTGIDNFRYFERSPSGLFLHEMTILKNVLHFSRYGHNLIEDNFTDITISRCFWKLTSQGLEMLIVSTFLVSECYCVESVEIRSFFWSVIFTQCVRRQNIPILQKYCTYFRRVYYYISIFSVIYCFDKNNLIYFAGSGLGLIILKWNDIHEVAVTDPIVRNHYIAKKF